MKAREKGKLFIMVSFIDQVAGAAPSAGGGTGFGGLKNATSFTGSNTVYDLLDSSKSRNAISGLIPGGLPSMGKKKPNFGFQSMSGTGGATAAMKTIGVFVLALAPMQNYFIKT